MPYDPGQLYRSKKDGTFILVYEDKPGETIACKLAGFDSDGGILKGDPIAFDEHEYEPVVDVTKE